MFQPIIPAPHTEEHQAKWGKFNDAPPGFRELTEKAFVQSRAFSYTPKQYEFRQIRVDPQKLLLNITLYYLPDGTGYGIACDYWEGRVHFYAFGCDHAYVDGTKEALKRGVRLFSHDHASVCKKCGDFRVVDSSD